ncbi:hypothetical protein V6N13_051107 [Hibiscus sabdariffa]
MKKPDGSNGSCDQRRSEQDTVEESWDNGEVRMELDEHEGLVGVDEVPVTVSVLGREVASLDGIVILETSLNKEKHTVMRVGDELNGQINKSRIGRVLPASIRGNNNKPLSKPGSSFKELDGTKESASTSANTSNVQQRDASVQWRENGAFDHPNGDQNQEVFT